MSFRRPPRVLTSAIAESNGPRSPVRNSRIASAVLCAMRGRSARGPLQRRRAERSPADEVDLPGGDAGGLRVLDEGLRIEETEVAREVEVARQHLREACAELAARVAAQVLERHDRDRERLAARPEDLPGHDRSCQRRMAERQREHREHDDSPPRPHPAPRPPLSSEWNSTTNSRNSLT